MRIMHRARTGALALLALAAAGCQSLDVENINTPGVDDVFSRGENLEGAIAGAWNAFWGVAQGARTNARYPVVHLAAMGEELTSADADIFEVTQEPRLAYDNAGAGQWTNRKPWYDLYEAIANARDALQAIEAGAEIGQVTPQAPQGVDAPRAKVFAKFVMGVSHLYLGLLFDKAFITDEETDPNTYDFTFSPHPQVVAHGIALLNEAIAEAQAAPTNFTLPTAWINGQTITRDDLVRIMRSYIVRGLVYAPRTAAERAAVNWDQVLTLIGQGIQKNLAVQANQGISTTHSAYYQFTQLQTNARIDNRLIGPGDVSGQYQAWLALPLAQRAEITITSPDRRIHGAAGPTARGTKFERLATQTMSNTRGTYVLSRYRGVQFGTQYYQTGLITTMSTREMDFIRAEALYRLNRRAEVPAILNSSRVAAGLDPVTESGPPPGANCVPRKDDGTCGDLWDALMYEKRMDLFPTEAIISFADRRGWGLLPSGSLMHFPVHGRELETLGLPYYTFGGSLPGSVP